MTPSDTLRTAAERLRKLATAATPGPWRNHDTHLGQYGYTATVLSGDGDTTELRAWLPTMSQEPWDETRNVWADSAYIAAMHPGVGKALAAWLESWTGIEVAEDGPLPDDLRHALSVARQILGSTA
ncbi:hypothetical protein ACIOIM_29300 [Streptomyces albidoflavus]